MKKRKKLFFFGLMFLMIICFIELSLHAYYLISSKGSFLWLRNSLPMYEEHPYMGYTAKLNMELEHKTNEFQYMIYTNKFGRRCTEKREVINPDKPENTYRIVIIGPSFAFGWGVDHHDMFSTVMQRKLSNGINVEIINLASPGGASNQEAWLCREGAKFKPDLLVKTVYGFVHDGFLRFTPEAPPPMEIVDHYLIGYKDQNKKTNRVTNQIVDFIKTKLKNSSIVFYAFNIFKKERIFKYEGSQVEEFDRLWLDNEKLDKLTGRYERYVENSKRYISPEVETIFFYIPPSFIVHRTDLARWQHSIKMYGKLNFDDAIKNTSFFAEHLKSMGLHFLDTIPILQEHAKHARMYYWLDVHFTKEANEIVGTALADMVKERIFASARLDVHQ